MSEASGPPAKGATCPICRKPSVARFAPFCSSRCKQIDLNRWLTGVYAVPGDGKPANEDAPDGEE